MCVLTFRTGSTVAEFNDSVKHTQIPFNIYVYTNIMILGDKNREKIDGTISCVTKKKRRRKCERSRVVEAVSKKENGTTKKKNKLKNHAGDVRLPNSNPNILPHRYKFPALLPFGTV